MQSGLQVVAPAGSLRERIRVERDRSAGDAAVRGTAARLVAPRSRDPPRRARRAGLRRLGGVQGLPQEPLRELRAPLDGAHGAATARDARRKWLARIFDAGASQPVPHERSGFSYRPFRKGKRLLRRGVRRRAGRLAACSSWVQKLDYAYSAGSYGMAFYFRQGSRLLPGPHRLLRAAPIAGASTPPPRGSNPRFSKAARRLLHLVPRGLPAAARRGPTTCSSMPLPTGVGCERCHGPGRSTSRRLAPADIVNPARPAARAPARRVRAVPRVELLRACEPTGTSSATARAQPLAAYRVNFVGDPPEPDRFILLGSPGADGAQRVLEAVPAGKLVCTSCHDPHKSSFEQPASWWDAKCNDCHHDQPCTETAAARAAQGGPLRAVPHALRPADEPHAGHHHGPLDPEKATAHPPGSDDPAHLASWPDLVADPAPGDDVTALEAIAYLHADSGRRPRRGYDGSAARPCTSRGLYEMLAGHYEGAKQPWNVARAYSALLAFEPDDQGGLYGYARVMLERGADGAAEAMHALDRMLALDPDDPSALEAKAELLVRSGRTDDARPLFTRAAAVSPSAAASHVALAVLARTRRARRRRIAELEAARRIEPGDASILDRLHDAYAKSGDAAHTDDIERAQAYFSSRQGQAPTSATEWLPDGWR